MSGIKIDLIDYLGWKDSIRISNGLVELVVLTQVGIRIIHYGYLGEENMLFINDEQKGSAGGDGWKHYGGHRLWHSPQVGYRCNEPDNEKVTHSIFENGVILTQNTEPTAKIQKVMKISLDENSTRVSIQHQLINRNVWPVTLSAWALTMLGTNGISYIPICQRDTMFLPNFNLVSWPFTHLGDKRMTISDKYISVVFDASCEPWFKIGISNQDGWASYFVNGNVFVKKFEHHEDERYPDFGCSYETYTDKMIFELESLSPLRTIDQDESLLHQEEWFLAKAEKRPETADEFDSLYLHIIESL